MDHTEARIQRPAGERTTLVLDRVSPELIIVDIFHIVSHLATMRNDDPLSVEEVIESVGGLYTVLREHGGQMETASGKTVEMVDRLLRVFALPTDPEEAVIYAEHLMKTPADWPERTNLTEEAARLGAILFDEQPEVLSKVDARLGHIYPREGGLQLDSTTMLNYLGIF